MPALLWQARWVQQHEALAAEAIRRRGCRSGLGTAPLSDSPIAARRSNVVLRWDGAESSIIGRFCPTLADVLCRACPPHCRTPCYRSGQIRVGAASSGRARGMARRINTGLTAAAARGHRPCQAPAQSSSRPCQPHPDQGGTSGRRRRRCTFQGSACSVPCRPSGSTRSAARGRASRAGRSIAEGTCCQCWPRESHGASHPPQQYSHCNKGGGTAMGFGCSAAMTRARPCGCHRSSRASGRRNRGSSVSGMSSSSAVTTRCSSRWNCS